ncbi:Tn3 family transposase [Streptomyces sp. TRM68367]|nr:Tn3 family transposase [Streptomyces sp. TRM68367]
MPGVAIGGYGPLEALARSRVNLNKVITHWPDMLRVAGSLVTGQVAPATCCGCSAARTPHPARHRVRRVRADRQNLAPAARGRPGGGCGSSSGRIRQAVRAYPAW